MADLAAWAPAVLMVLAVTALFWKGGAWVGAVDEKFVHLAEKTSNLAEKTASLEEKTSYLVEKTASLEGIVREIQRDIRRVFRRLPKEPVEGGSPLRLTDWGKEIAEDLGAERWATDLAPTLLPGLRNLEPFEIDEFAVNYVREKLSDEWTRKVAASAYKFGVEKAGIRSVLRVVLRDALLRGTPSAKS